MCMTRNCIVHVKEINYVLCSMFYKEDHYTLLQTKYESSGPSGFGEDDFFFFYVLHMTPPGRGPYGPQGHGWQDL